MAAHTFTTTLDRDGALCRILIPFNPRAVFGKARAPVKVTLNGYTFRSTIALMGGPPCIPLRKSNRDAAGLDGTETLSVRVELDTEARDVTPPAELKRPLQSTAGAWDKWIALSYTHQREHVEAIENAKKPETRERRIHAALQMLMKK